jgi:GDP-L-fucose synthase
LRRAGYAGVVDSSEQNVDLADERQVNALMAASKPRYLFMAAGKVAGIAGNQKFPADLITDNLLVTLNVIRAVHECQPCKMVYLASSCSYPRNCAQPMRVEDLMSGRLEPTNQAYATSKLAGIQLCQAYRRQFGDEFIAAIPANYFGIEDDFSVEDSHVVGALIQRMHAAKERGDESVTIWGTGKARREFMFADDIAEACMRVMEAYSGEAPINLSGGEDVTIAQLAEMIKVVVGFAGELCYDATRPDGMPMKALDGTAMAALGWKPQNSLREGLAQTYAAYVEQLNCKQECRGSAHA